MMNLLGYIVWNPDLEAFRISFISVRWYGLMWLIGFALGYFIVKRLYKEQKIKDELFDPLFIYCFFGILIGARLGHCIFYQPEDFLTSWQGIVEMIFPIRLGNDGSWLGQTFGFYLIGYAGLASHGGTLGLMIALWLYVRKTKLINATIECLVMVEQVVLPKRKDITTILALTKGMVHVLAMQNLLEKNMLKI